MGLSIEVSQTKPGFFTVSPVGRIDSDNYELLDREIDKVLTGPVETVILDMAGVDFIASSGVGTIAKAKNSVNQKGAGFAMIGLQPQVKRVFEIIRLLPNLNVFESREELDEYLGRVQRRITGEEVV